MPPPPPRLPSHPIPPFILHCHAIGYTVTCPISTLNAIGTCIPWCTARLPRASPQDNVGKLLLLDGPAYGVPWHPLGDTLYVQPLHSLLKVTPRHCTLHRTPLVMRAWGHHVSAPREGRHRLHWGQSPGVRCRWVLRTLPLLNIDTEAWSFASLASRFPLTPPLLLHRKRRPVRAIGTALQQGGV